jgi:hypothetical protein
MRFTSSAIALLLLAACTTAGLEEVVNDFQSCADAGFPVMESHPRQCRGPDGTLYVEELTAPDVLADKIRVTSPAANALVKSTFAVTGQARGPWYFEASFPITVESADGTVLVTTIATANGEWMTEEFVPFTAEVKLPASAGSRGTLVLHKDNPSGLPEHDAQLRIPVRFE